jgi:hypothetical protein
MTDFGKFVVFKPVPGGYVYRAPNAWLFGASKHYLANETQKAEILTLINSTARPVLWITSLSWIVISIILETCALLWASQYEQKVPGLSGALVTIVLIFSVYAAFVISRQYLLLQMRPILSALTPTNNRITNSEMQAALANAGASSRLSPLRQRVLRIACIIGLVSSIGVLISRTIDVHTPAQSIWTTIYRANANSFGVIVVLAIVGFGLYFFSWAKGLI